MAKKWYVVHVFSGSEKKVCQNIEEQIVTKNLGNLIEEVLVKFENQPRNVKALLKQQGIYSRLIECSQKDSSKRVSQPQN